MTLEDLTAPGSIVEPWDLEEAVNLFLSLNLPDAEIITHNQMAGIIGVPLAWGGMTYSDVKDFSFERLGRFTDFRLKLLIDHQLCLKVVRGTGYQIVPPGEQMLYAQEIMQKGLKKTMGLTTLIASNIRTEGFTNAERSKMLDAEVKLADFDRAIKKGRRDIFADLDD